MRHDIEILLALTVIGWVLTTQLVAKTSPLRTYLRYLDAATVFPMIVLLLPLSIWAAEQLAPMLLDAAAGLRNGMKPLASPRIRHAIVVAIILIGLAPIPYLFRWGWRRFLLQHDERIMAARAAKYDHR